MINFLLILTLILISYQDIRYRLVYAWTFILLIILSFINHYTLNTPQSILNNSILNLIFIGIQAISLWIWFRFREKSLKNSIGMGDIIFVFAMIVGFEFDTFIYLYIASLIFSLLTYIIFINKEKTVPLAGFMSFCWIIYIIYYEL